MAAKDNALPQNLPLILPSMSIDARNLAGRKRWTEGQAEDLVARNGYAAGLIQTEMDRVIGAHYRLQMRPDAAYLGISPEQASEFGTAVESEWLAHTNSAGNYFDAARKRSFSQMSREAVRQDVLYGEAIFIRQWRPSASGYSTCWQLIHPSRICNPNGVINTPLLREGVELNEYGEAIAYHVRSRTQLDIGSGVAATWQRIPTYNKFGVRQIIHVSDQLEADQTRGISRLAPVVQKLAELDTYEKAELDAALLGALYTLVITSEHGAQSAFDALGTDSLKKHLSMQAAFHANAPVQFQGSKIPHLFPGETLQTIANTHPTGAFEPFRFGVLGHIARGTGLSAEELSGDFSKTSYSSARASLEVSERTVRAKRQHFVNDLSDAMFMTWAQEAVSRGALPDIGIDLSDPRKFEAALAHIWVANTRIQIDPAKVSMAEQRALDNGTTTLAAVCAAHGDDWKRVLEQRARELEYARQLGVPISLITDLPPEMDATLSQDQIGDSESVQQVEDAAESSIDG